MPPSRPAERAALWALLAGNFVIGTGVLLPAGLSNTLSEGLAVSAGTVGTLIGYGALVLAIAAPLSALLTNRVERRRLLVASLALFAAGHLWSAFATSFDELLAARCLLVVGAAVFTPQAASTVSQFVSPERRGSAVAFVFMGWSIATAAGIPAASIVGEAFGWQVPYLAIAIASALALVAAWITLPAPIFVPPLALSDWRALLSSPRMLLILAVTTLSIAGMFVLYPYVAAALKDREAGPGFIAAVLGLYGIAGVLGALAATRVVDRVGAPHAVQLCLIAVLGGILLWHGSGAWVLLSAIGIFVWGLGFGPSVSAQQARLIGAAPPLASASIALNASFLYAGQSIGASIGAQLIRHGHARGLGLVGALLVVLALGLSIFVEKRLRA